MTKKLLITLFIIALLASCGTRERGNNNATEICTCIDGVVINGVCWATRNVDMPGTFAETPESFGMLFQWNRKKAWNAVDESVENWDSSIPTGTKWYAENDPCPPGWRVPTWEEFETLEDAGSEWVTQNGVNGRLFGTAPNQLFLPAAGVRDRNTGVLEDVGYEGNYWGNTQHDDNEMWGFVFLESVSLVGYTHPAYAFAVRCVSIEAPKIEQVEISASLDGVVIDGVRWATRNVDTPGTFAPTPESFGMFYQWNRRKAWNVTDEDVENWDNTNATGTTWYAENDPCPTGWRVPTADEWRSLDAAGSEWTTRNGVRGHLFGTAPNQIFLPAAGNRVEIDGSLVGVGRGGNYFSSSHSFATFVYSLRLGRVENTVGASWRSSGQSIRCVAVE